MNDVISRGAVLAAISESRRHLAASRCRLRVDDVLRIIYTSPPLDMEPVRHAHFVGWEYDGYADGFPVFDSWVCSECGEEFRSEGDPPAFNFCPACGARMDGDPHDSGQ